MSLTRFFVRALSRSQAPVPELGQPRLVTFLSGVLVQLVERPDVDEELVAVAEDEPDRLLPLASHRDRLEPRELADPVVDVNDEVAGLQGLHLAERQPASGPFPLARGGAVVAVEDLVVGVDREVASGDLEPLVERLDQERRRRLLAGLDVAAEKFEEPVALRGAVAEDDRGPLVRPRLKLLPEAEHVGVDVWLRRSPEVDRLIGLARGERTEEEPRVVCQSLL